MTFIIYLFTIYRLKAINQLTGHSIEWKLHGKHNEILHETRMYIHILIVRSERQRNEKLKNLERESLIEKLQQSIDPILCNSQNSFVIEIRLSSSAQSTAATIFYFHFFSRIFFNVIFAWTKSISRNIVNWKG